MSDEPTKADVIKSVEPKSNQLNADDLLTGPITVTIESVKRGDKDQPIVVEIAGHRPYKPCKTMRRVLIAVFSDDPKNWVGQQMTLYCDPDVMWAGVRVGGIRISHLSGLSEPKTFLITQTRGKKAEVTIRPVVQISKADRAYIDDALKQIAEATTMEVLNAIGFLLKEKSAVIQDAVRPVFRRRKEEIEKGA